MAGGADADHEYAFGVLGPPLRVTRASVPLSLGRQQRAGPMHCGPQLSRPARLGPSRPTSFTCAGHWNPIATAAGPVRS